MKTTIRVLSLALAAAAIASSQAKEPEIDWANAQESDFMVKKFRIVSKWSGMAASASNLYSRDGKSVVPVGGDNAEVYQAADGDRPELYWYLYPVSRGSFIIVNAASGRALRATGCLRQGGACPGPKWDTLVETLTLPNNNRPEVAANMTWEIISGDADKTYRIKLKGKDLFLLPSNIRTDHGYEPAKDHKGAGALLHLCEGAQPGSPHCDPKYQQFELKATRLTTPTLPKKGSGAPMPPPLKKGMTLGTAVERSEEFTAGFTWIPAIYQADQQPSRVVQTPFLLLERRVAYVLDKKGPSRENPTSIQLEPTRRSTKEGTSKTSQSEFTRKVGITVSSEVGGAIGPVGVSMSIQVAGELGYTSTEGFTSSWETQFDKPYHAVPPMTTLTVYHLSDIFVLRKPLGNGWTTEASWEVPTDMDSASECKLGADKKCMEDGKAAPAN